MATTSRYTPCPYYLCVAYQSDLSPFPLMTTSKYTKNFSWYKSFSLSLSPSLPPSSLSLLFVHKVMACVFGLLSEEIIWLHGKQPLQDLTNTACTQISSYVYTFLAYLEPTIEYSFVVCPLRQSPMPHAAGPPTIS